MKLFYLKPLNQLNINGIRNLIILAISEKNARIIASKYNFPFEENKLWIDSTKTSCIEIVFDCEKVISSTEIDLYNTNN